MSFANDSGVSADEVEEYFRGRDKTVITFIGFSEAGYEDTAAMLNRAGEVLSGFSADKTIVNIGATPDGIGAIYKVAKDRGFETTGIVSIQAKKHRVAISPHVDVVFFVADESWGGFLKDSQELSPTSKAMVRSSDQIFAIGGGDVGRDEMIAAKRMGKKVSYFAADKNHQRAIDQAREKGLPAPTDFRGAAFSEFGVESNGKPAGANGTDH